MNSGRKICIDLLFINSRKTKIISTKKSSKFSHFRITVVAFL